MTVCLGLVATAKSQATEAQEQRPDLVFLVDPDLGMDPGVRTTISLTRIFFRYDEVLRGDCEGRSEPTLGILGRAAKVGLLDGPLAFMALTFSHEVFGHGARAREQGLETTYHFRLVQPYRSLFGESDAMTGEARFGRQGQEDRDLALVTGGIESDYRAAHWLARDVVLHGGAHYGDMIMYAAARLSYASSFLDPASASDPSDDVRNYVSLLQKRFNRWTDADRSGIETRLRTAYLWNLADPTLVFAGYAVIAGHVVDGRRWIPAPLPTAWGVTFLPRTSLALSPFGAEHALDLTMVHPKFVIDVQGRMGSSGLASYGGAGIRLSNIHPTPFLQWSSHIDLWTQPEILWAERNVFDRPNRLGGNIGTEGVFALSPSTGFVLAVAYKTSGFLPGRPMDKGLYGYTGLSWSAP